MKALITIFALFREARKSFAFKDKRALGIFYTLLSLYIKSKFSKKDNGIITHRIDQFIVHAYDYPTLIELYQEIFLNAVYHFETTDTNPLIVDCGANIGMSVLFFKKCFPGSKVWAFEPNPNSFALLERNVKDNDLTDVKLFPFALSDSNDFIEFYVPLNKGSLNGSSWESEIKSERIKVESRKLSELIQGRKVACLKIDVEGDEEKIIWDLADSHVLEGIDCLVVEYHQTKDHSPNSLSRFLFFMEEAGFSHQQLPTDSSKKEIILHFNKKPVLI
ncbi:MAG TPA: FkbM family methyltransferase [Cyclobacteriaceae bacterium]